jgi:hypothetical protein
MNPILQITRLDRTQVRQQQECLQPRRRPVRLTHRIVRLRRQQHQVQAVRQDAIGLARDLRDVEAAPALVQVLREEAGHLRADLLHVGARGGELIKEVFAIGVALGATDSVGDAVA